MTCFSTLIILLVTLYKEVQIVCDWINESAIFPRQVQKLSIEQ